MDFIADLHVHSRYSRATARNLDLENLYIAAQIKGIQVVATGDATHPAWFEEIRSKLVEAEPGLFRLRDDIARVCDREVPASCRGIVRFVLNTEISNIYKKDGFTRKNHNLVFLPDIAAADSFNRRLDRIGNIKSDGRPILGLDARNLLEIVLETDARGYLVPAHIWTPWFSLLGSKSGFDTLEACFEDLAPHIFAVETGLSSDPPMNWRVSGLDGLTLISNSDAHSPMKLGREANRFACELSYDAIRRALENRENGEFKGTFEFYPEEGKYHLNGHRKCGVRLTPAETRQMGGRCPVCARPLTLGVLHRVEDLADRPEGWSAPAGTGFQNLLPLTDILAEILEVGPSAKKVQNAYATLIEELGSEFDILQRLPLDVIERADMALLTAAIERMRDGRISISGGFDGEFGRICIFDGSERCRLMGQQSLFAGAPGRKPRSAAPTLLRTAPAVPAAPENQPPAPGARRPELNAEQHQAVHAADGPQLIVAGPGTGKTFTLTRRIVHLIQRQQVPAAKILAVTFTNKAAEEMRQRIAAALGPDADQPLIGTFHGLCYRFLAAENADRRMAIVDENDRRQLLRDAMDRVGEEDAAVPFAHASMLGWIVDIKQRVCDPEQGGPGGEGAGEAARRLFLKVYRTYQALLNLQNVYDYDDLVAEMVRRLSSDPGLTAAYRRRYPYLFVDEYQDLNHAQYLLIRHLAPPGGNLCVIGDPDQSIYGFRGSDAAYFRKFTDDWPGARVTRLTRNYRSSQVILDGAVQMIGAGGRRSGDTRLVAEREGRSIGLVATDSDQAEAVVIGKTIERLVGGSGFQAIDFGAVDGNAAAADIGFGDIAVLFRTQAQGRLLAGVLEDAGIPCQLASRESLLEQPPLAALLALLRIVGGQAGFVDLERVSRWVRPSAGRHTLKCFRFWCYRKRMTVAEGMHQAVRLPITGLGTRRQRRLMDFFTALRQLQEAGRDMSLDTRIGWLIERTTLGPVFAAGAMQSAREHLEKLVPDHRSEESLFFDHLALCLDTDVYDDRAEKVALLTLHASKGLEFPVVFIAGCEDDLIPLRRPGVRTDFAEERRLFFVGMTRARDRLYLCHAKRRRVHGKTRERSLSPFVRDIEARLTADESVDRPAPRKPKQVQMRLF